MQCVIVLKKQEIASFALLPVIDFKLTRESETSVKGSYHKSKWLDYGLSKYPKFSH